MRSVQFGRVDEHDAHVGAPSSDVASRAQDCASPASFEFPTAPRVITGNGSRQLDERE